MSLKDGSKLLEEMSPFNNRKIRPHGESLENRGIMETVSCRFFNYSSFSLLEIQDQNPFVSFPPELSVRRVKLEEDALSFILLSQQNIWTPRAIFLIWLPLYTVAGRHQASH